MQVVTRQLYRGSSRKLVLAFDVGTTCSGISYTILDPGEVPKIFTVTSFPGQTTSGGDSKVPSVLYYDKNGIVQAIGQEAENLCESGQAEDAEWTRIEWFKLHLRPQEMNTSHIRDNNIPPLPTGKTITDVFADFFAYLYKCTKEYIRTTHAAGGQLLRTLEGSTNFVMGHPNGWGGLQQQRMRRAAVQAKLVPDITAAEDRIQFVTEGEASFYYCLENGLSSDVIKAGSKIMIVDAGGGTIDLSSYLIKGVEPITVEEIASPGCRLQGSVFVNQRASAFLFNKLKGSIYDDAQDIKTIVDCFERTVKRRFKSSSDPCHIRFGTRNDNEPDFGISRGVLKLTGEEVSGFFHLSLNAIHDAILEQQRSGGDIKAIFFVGGFAASDYLFSSLRRKLAGTGIEISRPDGYTNKAVADGAISFYMDNIVTTRVARATYGLQGVRDYDPGDPRHMWRTGNLIFQPSGCVVLPEAFISIVFKGSKVSEKQEYTVNLYTEATDLNTKVSKDLEVITYDGDIIKPLWTDIDPESYHTLCTIHADISQASRSLQPRWGPRGQVYYRFSYMIVLKFGLTELKAQIAWTENGKEKRSPASIVYLGDD